MAIAENSQLGFVRRIRERLQSFPITDALTADFAIDAVYFVIADKDRYKVGDLIEINDEIVQVYKTETVGAEDRISVYRGMRLTTAAAHSSAASINICGQLWTDYELKKIVNDSIYALRPEIAYQVIDKTLTTASSKREYDLPSGITEVSWIEIEKDTGVFLRERNAYHVKDLIVFNYQPAIGKTIKLIGWKEQVPFSGSVTELTLTEEFWSLIFLYGTAKAMESLLTNRSRYTEYSASLNPRASTTDEITRVIYYFMNQFRIGKHSLAPHKVGYSHRPRK